jgi:hypothetical protein
MKRKAAYFSLSGLIILSGTFGIAPMAFCSMSAQMHSSPCCVNTAPDPTPECPVCVFNQNKIGDDQANISLRSAAYFQNVIAIVSSGYNLSNLLYRGKYPLSYSLDTSPPLYLKFGILRL